MITLFTGLQDAGAIGIIFYGIGFTLWVFLTVPSTLVGTQCRDFFLVKPHQHRQFFKRNSELCAGFIWGAPLATAVGACAKTIGCTLTFLLGRKIGNKRNWKAPQALLNRWPSGEHQIARTLLFIFAMRFAPLPLAMKNVGLALIPGWMQGHAIAIALVITHFVLSTLNTYLPAKTSISANSHSLMQR